MVFDMPLVSVIVPVYNTSMYLKKCLDSLVSQTLSNIEIIVINDGSTDNSEEIIKSYSDSRIVYIKKKNEGIGKTRNLGIQQAHGEYLMFIDSDDYIALNCIERFYNKASLSDCDIVISNYYEDKNGYIKDIIIESFDDTSLKIDPLLITKINLGPCNKIYRRNLFNDKNIRFNEELKYEDVPFVCRALLSSTKIGKINECLSYYVIHENSETTTRNKKIFDILEIVNIIISDMKKYDYMNEACRELVVNILTDYTVQQRYIKDKKERNRFIDEAYEILNLFDNWKNSECLRTYPYMKRLVKCNKMLTKIYCTMYNLI